MTRAMEFAVITVPRNPFYLVDTVRSLKETGFFKDTNNLPLRLVCSGKFKESDENLNPFRNNTSFQIEHTNVDLLSIAKPTSAWNGALARDVCVNHRRGILGLAKSRSTHLCIFEDDIKLSMGWLPRLHETISDIEKSHGNRWILTLFARDTDEPLKKMDQGFKWYPYEKRPYWGTLGTVYPREIAISMEPSIWSDCIMDYKYPIDELVGHYADKNKIPFLASAPSLVQHIGDISSGISKMGKRTSQGFVEKIANF